MAIQNSNGDTLNQTTLSLTVVAKQYNMTPLADPVNQSGVAAIGDRCGSTVLALDDAVNTVIINGTRNVRNIIGAGDYCETGYTYERLNQQLKQAIVDRGGSFAVSMGNHDYDGTNEAYWPTFWNFGTDQHWHSGTFGNIFVCAYNDNTEETAWNAGGYSAASAAAQEASTGGQWVRDVVSGVQTAWKIVSIHRPPYSSGTGGNTTPNQMHFADWGYDVVVQGHIHGVERLYNDGIYYLTNAMGGDGHHGWATTSPFSQWRETDTTRTGFLQFFDSPTDLQGRWIDIGGTVRDEWRIGRFNPAPVPQFTVTIPDQDVNVGSTVVLTATATGAEKYVWLWGTTAGTYTVLDGTTDTLTISDFSTADVGTYYARALSDGGYVQQDAILDAMQGVAVGPMPTYRRV